MRIKQHGVTPGEPQEWAPVFFTSLTVENFRCFTESQTLNLARSDGRPAPWTVIIGENGVGKTTLLQCLAGLTPEYVASSKFLRPSSAEDEIKVEYLLTPKLATQSWLKIIESGSRSPGESLHIRGSIIVGRDFNTVDYTDAESLDHDDWGISYKRDPAAETQFTLSFTQDPLVRLGALVCYGYGASSRLATKARGEQVGYDTTATLLDIEAALPNAEEWLLNLDHVAKTDGSKDKVKVDLSRTLEILKNVLPDVSEIRFGIIKKTGVIRPEFQTPYGWVTIDQLGLGFQSMIAWVLDLVHRMIWRYPESVDPLAEPAIVLIDELDMHLHPAWQRKVMHYLSEKFPNTQFIATVHSPLVVQTAAESANIAVLRRCTRPDGTTQVVIDNQPENVRGWRLDQILTSDLYNLPLRSDSFEELTKRRVELLSRPVLSEAEQKEVAELNRQYNSLPTEDEAEDRNAMDILREAASILQNLK